MITNRNVRLEERNGNLHVRPHGQFCAKTAEIMAAMMSNSYRGKGNIFIHTKLITQVSPDSREMFNEMVGTLGLPRKSIYLMGETGKDICHDEGRVIVPKARKTGHRCGGNCANCSCKNKLQ